MFTLERLHRRNPIHLNYPAVNVRRGKSEFKWGATNLVLLGKHGAGKGKLFKTFQEYFETTHPEDTQRHLNRLTIKNDTTHVVISDINLPLLLEEACMYSITKGDAFILVYSVDDLDSFKFVESAKDYLKRQDSDKPVIILGINNDRQTERAMRYELVDCLVNIDWEIKYEEFSAFEVGLVPSILQMLVEVVDKDETSFPPDDDDNEAILFPNMIFRPRAYSQCSFRPRSFTDSKLLQVRFKDVKNSQLSSDQQISRDDQEELPKSRARLFSLPSFLIRKSLPKRRKVSFSRDTPVRRSEISSPVSRLFLSCVEGGKTREAGV